MGVASPLPGCPHPWNGGAHACLSAWLGALTEVTWVNVGVNAVLLGWGAMLGKIPTVCRHLSGALWGPHVSLLTLGGPF